MQDNDGGEVSDVVSSAVTLEVLIAAIEAIDPALDYSGFALDPVDDAEGGQPGGNIRVAFLYRADRVEPDLAGATRIEGEAFEDTRLPLVVPFGFGDEVFRVVNVHLSSKGGSDPLYGTVQPPVDSTIALRTAQAQAIFEHLTSEAATTPAIILGDFNSFYYEAPMKTLTGQDAGFVNLTEAADVLDRASYIFDGNSQALDHVLVSEDMAERAELFTFHVNSRFPESDELSDHDPKLLIVRSP